MTLPCEMKALVKAHAEPGLWLETRPLPQIGDADVLIKVSKTGICGTDLHIFNWDEWAAETVPVPLVVGHEFCGTIVQTGRLVQNLNIGQRVSGEGHLIQNRSRASRAGRFHLDPDTRGIGVNEQGAFAEYVRLPAFNAVPLPDEIEDSLGAILDPLGNAVHTALSFDLVGEDVLITGAGPIGIMSAAVAVQAGARKVVLTDINDRRLALARQIPGIHTVDVSAQKLADVATSLGLKEGFDVGFEMSGAPKAFTQMVEHMVMGGKIAMLGVPSRPTEVNWARIVFKGLTIKGIYGREIFETWYKMLALLDAGLPARSVITHELPAADFLKGFELMNQGSCGKVILDWNGI